MAGGDAGNHRARVFCLGTYRVESVPNARFFNGHAVLWLEKLQIHIFTAKCSGMATTYIVRQLGVVSIGKFFAVFGLVWGFFMGLVMAAGVSGMGSVMGGLVLGFGVGLIGLVFITVLGGVLGFIGGAIVAIIYNFVLGATGGVEMDLDVKA